MKIGYIRVSTDKQHTDRQHEILASYKLDRVFEEKITGKYTDRPELKAMMDCLREGDTLYVESFSRLSRSVKDLLHLTDTLSARGVALVSHKEQIDGTTPQGRLMFTVFAALSQFERDIITERTIEGLEAARKKGNKGGKPRVDSEKINRALMLNRTTKMSVRAICKLVGISTRTLYNYRYGIYDDK